MHRSLTDVSGSKVAIAVRFAEHGRDRQVGKIKELVETLS